MKILAIDTSSSTCSVAITEDTKKIIELNNTDEKTHSIKLMPIIDEAFKSSNLTLNDIDLLVCSLGPGSFTGVRIGISTVKAFSDSLKIPAIGVCSLEGLSYNQIDDSTPLNMISSTLYCSIIDAKNNNVYCGLYRYYNHCLNQITDLISEDINTVISKINTTLTTFNDQFKYLSFVGDGTIIYKDLLENSFKNYNITVNFAENNKNYASGISIAKAGYLKYINGFYSLESNNLLPLYLRKSQAERALEEKK